MKNKILVTSLLAAILILPSIIHALEVIYLGSISEYYNDNINSSGQNKESDFITDIMLGIGMNHVGRTQTFRCRGNIYQRLYIDHKDMNDNYQDAELFYSNELSGRQQIQLNDSFMHHPQSIEFQDTFNRISGNANQFYSNAFQAAYIIFLSSQLNTRIAYRNQINNYLSGNVSDSYLNGGLISLDYSIMSGISASIMYDIEKRTFDTGGSITKHSPGIQYQHTLLDRHLTLALTSGINYFKIDSNIEKKISKPYIHGLIEYKIDRNNILQLMFSRQYDISIDYPDPYGTKTITATFTREISRSTSTSLSAFYGVGKYEITGSNMKLLGTIARLNYELKGNTNIALIYSFVKNNSTIYTPEQTERNNYIQNQIQLTVSTQF